MKAWRDAASVILVARTSQRYSGVSSAAYDYNLLCLQRHRESRFMAGKYVFPGGVVDPADSDLKWRELFNTFGFNNDSLTSLIPRTTRSLIFKSQQGELPREISLRITAIRETFEECGTLLCRHKDDRAPAAWSQPIMSIPKDELKTWQSKIHKNAAEFITLCQKFECYPNLWGLYEWRNWLTPTYMKNRFDTIFFLACMPFVPQVEYDRKEMQDLKWGTPEDILCLATDLPPSQQYEITLLSDFKNINDLLDCAVKCNKAGVQTVYLPVPVHLKDGVIYVLPGDTMYPKEINLVDNEIISKTDITVDEYNEMTPVKNRTK